MTNQQLKAHCEDVIANPQDHLDWVVDMARVALASLEAVPVGYVSNYSRKCAADGHLGYISNHMVAGLEGGYVYDAPPVPEQKPIELPQLISSWEGNDVISGRNRGITDCAEALRKQGYEVKA